MYGEGTNGPRGRSERNHPTVNGRSRRLGRPARSAAGTTTDRRRRPRAASPEGRGPGATPETASDRFSSEYLAAVAARTVTEVGELRQRAAEAGKRLPTFTLETAIRFASPADRDEFLKRLSHTVARLVSEYHDASSTNGRWFRLVLGSHPALVSPGSNATSETSTSDSEHGHD